MKLDFGFALAARGLSGVLLAAALLATTLTAQAQALPQPGPVYEIRAKHSGKCLDVAHGSLAHAADVIQATCSDGDNQKWKLEWAPNGRFDLDNTFGYFRIVAQHSKKCLDVAHRSYAHAADVIQGTCVDGSNQHWSFSIIKGPPYGFFAIRARHSGKCLDVAHYSMAHAADVIQANCSGGRNQQWSVFYAARP